MPSSSESPGAAFAAAARIAEVHGRRTVLALVEMVRLTDVAARLVERGHAWFVSDPENTPGMAAEAIVIKLGENAARVAQELRSEEPSVPWRSIIDMRNRLVHDGEGMDYEVVWATLEVDLPVLRDAIRAVLDGRTGTSSS